MASDDAIKTIVAQVMDKLQAGGVAPRGTGLGAGLGTGRGLGLGGGLGRATTARPVGGNLGAVYSDSHTGRSGGAAPSTLVVLTAGDARLDDLYRALGRIADQAPVVRIYLSPSARKLLDLPAIRRACPGAEILPGEVTHELRALVESADAVYLPTLTLCTASKIGFLEGDTAASLMPIFALSLGKPVMASTHAMYGLRQDYPPAPAGFRQRVDKILEKVQEVGVQLVDLDAMGGGSATARAPVAPATAQRAAAPAPAAPAAYSASPGTGCGASPETCAGCGQCAEKNPSGVTALVTGGADRIGAAVGTKVSNREVASLIDHTMLKADATESDIRKLCAEAREHVFASVCVNPGWVSVAARELQGSPVKVCTVIGFPLGATTPTAKAIETRDAIANGATEVDMVINVGALKSGNDDLVRRDIAAVVESARGQALVKVILETALLSREEKVKACLLAKMAGADFVKTSTGFSTGGATVEDIALMRETVGPDMGVKASGGIKSPEDAQAMIAAGATRIGASASVAIAKGQTSTAKGY